MPEITEISRSHGLAAYSGRNVCVFPEGEASTGFEPAGARRTRISRRWWDMGSRLFAAPRTWPAEYPIRDSINRIINCIRAADFGTTEITPEDAGYAVEDPGDGHFEVALHVVQYIKTEEPAFMGLVKRQVQKMIPVCVMRFDGSAWSIHASEIFSTEKLSDLYRHLKYYNFDVRLEGITEDLLGMVYKEARAARPGAMDPHK